MFIDRISLARIYREHLDTFHDYRKIERNLGEIRLYFFWPIIPAIIFLILFDSISNSLAGILTNFFSIFCGLLFSFIVVLKSEYEKLIDRGEPDTQALALETFSNTAFSIFLAIVTLSLLLIYGMFSQPIDDFVQKFMIDLLSHMLRLHHILGFEALSKIKFVFIKLLSIAIVYAAALFIITLLIVIKRLYRICKPTHSCS